MSRNEQFRDAFSLGLQEASRSGRLIQGVSVHGAISRNGRRYTESARADIRDHIEAGRNQVFGNHEDGVRAMESLVGVLKRPRLADDRIKADLQVVDAEPWRSLLPSLAEEMPGAAGLSIRAKGRVRETQDGTHVVESVDQLFGTDLVTEPATTSALVESLQRDRRETVEETLRDEGVDPEPYDIILGYLAAEPDPEAAAEEYAREFKEIARRPPVELVESRSRSGTSARSAERDPDQELLNAAEGLWGDRRSRRITPEEIEEAADRLW